MAREFEHLKKQMRSMIGLERVLKEMRKVVDYNVDEEEDDYIGWVLENYGEAIESPRDIPTNELEIGHIYSSLRIVQDFLDDMR